MALPSSSPASFSSLEGTLATLNDRYLSESGNECLDMLFASKGCALPSIELETFDLQGLRPILPVALMISQRPLWSVFILRVVFLFAYYFFLASCALGYFTRLLSRSTAWSMNLPWVYDLFGTSISFSLGPSPLLFSMDNQVAHNLFGIILRYSSRGG